MEIQALFWHNLIHSLYLCLSVPRLQCPMSVVTILISVFYYRLWVACRCSVHDFNHLSVSIKSSARIEAAMFSASPGPGLPHLPLSWRCPALYKENYRTKEIEIFTIILELLLEFLSTYKFLTVVQQLVLKIH